MRELERSKIQRSDFAKAKHGWDPDEVDAHLRSVADAVEAQNRATEADSTGATAADRVKQISDAASTQVKGIIEAAERSAAEMRAAAAAEARKEREAAAREVVELHARAREEADRVKETSERAAREATERVEALVTIQRDVLASARSLLERFGEGAGALLNELEAVESSAAEGRATGTSRVADGGSAERPVPGPGAPWREPAAPDNNGIAVPASGAESEGPARLVATELKPTADRLRHLNADASGAGPSGHREQRMALVAFDMVVKGAGHDAVTERLRSEFDLCDDDRDMLEQVFSHASAKAASWSSGSADAGPLGRRRRFLRR